MHFISIVFRTAAAGLMLSSLGASAFAQTPSAPVARASAPRAERVVVAASVGIQTRTPGFSEVQTATLYAEEARFENRYGANVGNLFEIGAAARVWRNVWVGGALAQTSHRHGMEASARLPHPLRFDEIRVVDGANDELDRKETGRHIQVMYRARIGSRIDVSVFAGPSWIKAEQDVVTEVRFDEVYPFDTVTFAGTSSANASATGTTMGFGVSLGVDVFGPVSVGLQVRRAATSVDFEIADGRTVRATVGGTQLLLGARVTF